LVRRVLLIFLPVSEEFKLWEIGKRREEKNEETAKLSR
jgi:hypothetical protein